MVDVQSIQQLVDELAGAAAQEKLVVVEFFATWCTGCRALHPLMIQLAADRPEIRFLMIDGDENKVGALGVGWGWGGLGECCLVFGGHAPRRYELQQTQAWLAVCLCSLLQRQRRHLCSSSPASPMNAGPVPQDGRERAAHHTGVLLERGAGGSDAAAGLQVRAADVSVLGCGGCGYSRLVLVGALQQAAGDGGRGGGMPRLGCSAAVAAALLSVVVWAAPNPLLRRTPTPCCSAAVERWSVPRCSLGGAPPLPGFAGVKPRTGKMVAA